VTILDGCICLNSVQKILVVLGVVDMCHLLLTVTVRNSYILIDNLNQKWEYENECEIPPLFCDDKSLACFQKPNLTFDYSDPYNNTFGEKKMSIIIGVLLLLTLFLMGMFLMMGIVFFERFALKNQRRLLLDMVSMAIPVVEFSREGYKIKKIFG
jgi:hypothetical protein